jgi:DNA-directed RNA polymerase beta subunit
MQVREARDFSKRGDALPIPNLIDVQIESYQRFLQKDTDPTKRKYFRSKVTTGIFASNTSATNCPNRGTPPMSVARCV